MAKNIKQFDVFISSPSDVDAERDIVEEAIDQINKLKGEKEGFRLNPLRWERDVAPEMGGQPQALINKQIGDDYDIFVGILCNRFGQKTENFDSGTEEEFRMAFDRLSSDEGGPEILFYFKDPRRSELPIDAEQFLKVSKFKEQIGSLGVYGEFDTPENLKTKLLTALMKALDRISEAALAEAQGDDRQVDTVSENSSAMVVVDSFDEDLGLMELSDMISDALDNFIETIDRMAASTARFGTKLMVRTNEISNLKQTGDTRQDRKNAKLVVDKVASEMRRFTHLLDQDVPDARREFGVALRCTQHAVIISDQDGMTGDGELEAIVDSFQALRNTIDMVYGQVAGFKDAIGSTPRLTSNLNQAKRHAMNSVSDLLEFFTEASASIDDALEAIQR
ncbi:DUF4062 domain-containing protein [Shimia sp. MMG029]|uniref:DUF4062 domain-containing protein n=1 Tax=Shimia sp. MMG029 TaxID=3021978 RepID=UPI0022FE11BC|nr:DUF4062 domain-containing protein [Shimia sp. MMG029]MDA5558820.1 DUF4062 domain-containing protein [Shimia sp. MMG029]